MGVAREADAAGDGGIAVAPDNRAAVETFLGLSTQWRVSVASGLGGSMRWREGLDYAALPATCAALGHVLDADLFAAVRVMEAETLRLDRARLARDAARRRSRAGAPRGRR
jgi:hypothetical protein